MVRNDKNIPKQIEKRIYQEAGSMCVFCSENNIPLLEIHHIIPREQNGSNEPENLILVCRNCHALIESQQITQEQVKNQKGVLGMARIYKMPGTKDSKLKNTVNISGNVSSSIVANKVEIKGGAKLPSHMNYPAGSIGENLDQRNYIQYLVNRYHDYRKADASYGRQRRYNFGVIHKNIESKFKAKTFFIPQERFNELVTYLYGRINATIQGKRNKSLGRSNYDSFENYVEDQHK